MRLLFERERFADEAFGVESPFVVVVELIDGWRVFDADGELFVALADVCVERDV